MVKNRSRDNRTAIALQYYILELKSNRIENRKLKEPYCHCPNCKSRYGHGQAVLAEVLWVGKNEAMTQHPSTTWTTTNSLSTYTSLNLHFLDLVPLSGYPNPYRHDFMFFKLCMERLSLLQHLIITFLIFVLLKNLTNNAKTWRQGIWELYVYFIGRKDNK